MDIQAWQPVKLDDLGFVGRGKSRHRPRNEPSLYGGKYPFFQTGDIKAANLRLSQFSQTYNEKGLAQSKLWQPGTLCITIAANIAETAILGIPGCFPDSVVGFIADANKADVRFIKYYIDTIKLQMQSVSRGTTQDNLSVDKLLSFDFRVPPLPLQRRIAGILSAYDDLIENNLRRIRILEEMARALYREWFVHFRFPGHEAVPLVDSPLGPIPQGWDVKPFSALASYINGYPFKPAQLGTEGFPIIKIKELKAGIVADTPRNAGDGIPEKYSVLDGDVLFSWSADLDTYLWMGGEGLLNQHLFNVVPFQGLTRAFCFHALQEAMPRFRALSLGATMHHIKRSALDQVFTVVAPAPMRERFDVLVAPMHQQLITLTKHLTNLRHTRNLLLPRLLSGEVELSGLECDAVAPTPPLAPAISRPALGIPIGVSTLPVSVPTELEESLRAAGEQSLHAPSSHNGSVPRRTKLAEEPAPFRTQDIGLYETDEVMAAFRQAARAQGEMTREQLLKEVSLLLGYQRLGPKIEEVLRGHLRAAIRRRIISANATDAWLETPTMGSYTRDELVATFTSVMRVGTQYEREDIQRAVANHLGFRRLTETTRAPLKSAINSAIRQGTLGYEGSLIWRNAD